MSNQFASEKQLPAATRAAAEFDETQLRHALKAARIGVWELNPATGDLAWDGTVREIVGAEPECAPTWQDHFLPAIHPDDLAPLKAALSAALTRAAPVDIDVRVVGARSRKQTWAHLTGSIQITACGRRLIGTARDITVERLRHAETLADRRIWADMVEAHDDAMVAIDANLAFTALNRAYVTACQDIFGREFLVGEKVSDVLDHVPSVRVTSLKLWSRALAGQSFEARVGGSELNERAFEHKFRPLHDAEGSIVGAYHVSREVTAQVAAERSLKEATQALQHAQKMETIGALSGGIAHDFNNLMQVIGGNLQLLSKDVAGSPKAMRRVDNALIGVDRAAKLTGQLLAFGRRQPLNPRVIDVGHFVADLKHLLQRTLGEETEILTNVADRLWNILVDRPQLDNALLNLAINGRDAMAGRGHLTVEASNAKLDETCAATRSGVAVGDYVLLAVTDTGTGIAPELMERVFEPFFSTKPDGHGTGLGLSMVHGFVKQSGGHVEIHSEVGHGTTVDVYLPRAEGKESAETVAHTAHATHGDVTILVVEDDEQVRETTASLLETSGYTVLLASDADAALTIVESGAKIDLVFTDVVMPGKLRSVEMVELARRQLPGVAVLFTSGYARDAIVHGGRLDAGVDLLTKPFTREALEMKVAEVLERRPIG